MISRDYIRELAGDQSYNRGISIFKNGKVKGYTSESVYEEEHVNARVKGSGNNVYEVELVVDNETDMLVDSYCECPAFYSYGGICKHCVAVLLEYRERTHKNKSIEEYLIEHNLKYSGPKAIKKGVKRHTSEAIKELLNRKVLNTALPLLDGEVSGKVRMIPNLIIYGNNISLEFKMGITQMYVLKDIFEFCENMEEGKKFSYGKKLEFIHTMNAFVEKDREIVQFLLDWVADNKDRLRQVRYHGYFGTQYYYPKTRNIPLEGSALRKFLKLFEGGMVYVRSEELGDGLFRVKRDDYTGRIKITGENDGIVINGVDGVYLLDPPSGIVIDEQDIHIVDKEKLTRVQEFIGIINHEKNKGIFIEKEDVSGFVRQLLPELKDVFECVTENFDEEAYGVLKPEMSVYLDMPQKDMVTCKVVAKYGEEEYNSYNTKEDIHKRDLKEEVKTGRIVSKYFNAYDKQNQLMVLSKDEDKLYELLTEGVEEIEKVANVFISDALKKLEVKNPPVTNVGVTLSGNLLELTISTSDMSMEQLVEILSKYDRKKKYYRLKNGQFIHMKDAGLESMVQMKKVLEITDNQMKKGVIHVPKYRAMYLDGQLKSNSHMNSKKGKNFKSLIRNMKTVEDNDFELPESLENILRGYQKFGFMWIKTLANNGFGGILADDMGLGKTLQVITFLLSEYSDNSDAQNKKTLIVCPASLVYNWKSELEKFAPSLNVRMITGTAGEREEKIKGISENEVIITSYDLLRRDIQLYNDIVFGYQIVDEAQYIKNHNTHVSKAVKEINSGFKLALTGTPVENKLSELHSIFEYLMPGFLFSYKKFKERIEQPIVKNQDEDAMERLQKMISPFVLRRLKKDVLDDLPDKIEENRYIEMEDEQQKIYDAHVKRMKLMLENTDDEEFKTSKIKLLAEITRLRQICCNPAIVFEDYEGNSSKTDACIELINDAVGNGHKILLFSQFTSMLDKLVEKLKESEISYYVLTGATPKEERVRMVEAFNSDDTSVFCISLKAGGTGLNLTAADIVIHYDPWWNVAVQNQATDRAYRIGQKNVVNVYKLVTANSIEENIMKLQEKKSDLANQVLSGEDIGKFSFNKEEMIELLS